MTVPVISYHKYKYIVVIVDNFTSYAWIGLIKTKDQTLDFFATWYDEFADPNQRILNLRSDRGGEFVNHAFNEFLKSKGIKHQQTAPNTPQQNGCVEHMNQTLTDKAEAMRLDAGCPKSWWEFLFRTAVHVYNWTPLKRTQWKTPLENLLNKKPDVSYF